MLRRKMPLLRPRKYWASTHMKLNHCLTAKSVVVCPAMGSSHITNSDQLDVYTIIAGPYESRIVLLESTPQAQASTRGVCARVRRCQSSRRSLVCLFVEPSHLELVPPDRRRYFGLQLRGRVRGRGKMRPLLFGGTRSAQAACLRLEGYNIIAGTAKVMQRSHLRRQAGGFPMVTRPAWSRCLLWLFAERNGRDSSLCGAATRDGVKS